VVFFVLPGAWMVVIPLVTPGSTLSGVPVIVFILMLVLVEEFLKMSAARTEHRGFDKFALVMLFGIFELLLAKPVGPFFGGELLGEWSRWGLIGATVGGLLALLMHSVTAAIYAYQFPERPFVAMLTCFAVHAIYNLVVLISSANVWVAGVLAILLGTALALLWPDTSAEPVEA
jgi:hypothetical protein